MITFNTPQYHWNYFLAIEKDLENLSRYVEFSNENLDTYSIAMTHILLSASSEVDVIMKQLCFLLDSSQAANNISDYRSIIKDKLPSRVKEEVYIDRYSLSFKPWDNWNGNQNPNWWRSYNNVKHQRNIHFREANLQNAINAVGALLISVVFYYKKVFAKIARHEINFKDTTRELNPKPSLLRMKIEYYYSNLIK